MGMGRSIGRSSWGFVCSEGMEKGMKGWGCAGLVEG